jgi:hypothetical protein
MSRCRELLDTIYSIYNIYRPACTYVLVQNVGSTKWFASSLDNAYVHMIRSSPIILITSIARIDLTLQDMGQIGMLALPGLHLVPIALDLFLGKVQAMTARFSRHLRSLGHRRRYPLLAGTLLACRKDPELEPEP